jgi:hypothetical protein
MYLALKMMGRALPGGARQARGLAWTEIAKFLAIADNDMRTVRERALLCVGYDAMTRREELTAVDCEDLTWCADGSARILIRRSKTANLAPLLQTSIDSEGEGTVLYLAPQTARYVRTWLQRSVITTGAVFRRIIGRARLGERLGADGVTDILKRVVARIGLAEEAVQATSGHSLRVGATQDLLALMRDCPRSCTRDGGKMRAWWNTMDGICSRGEVPWRAPRSHKAERWNQHSLPTDRPRMTSSRRVDTGKCAAVDEKPVAHRR